MSEFDKEAEREKLREKYEEDEADREATQRMSQLLLQGATMTNRHCDNCGDPIFRQDGRTFCPTCQGEGQPAEADADQTAEGAAARDADAAAAAETASADATADEDAESPSGNASDGVARPAQTSERNAAPSSHPEPNAAQSGGTRPPSSVASSDPAAPGEHSSPSPDSASSLQDADAALVAALNRFAGAAANTDDPRRAKDHLAAAREAAEALDALRR